MCKINPPKPQAGARAHTHAGIHTSEPGGFPCKEPSVGRRTDFGAPSPAGLGSRGKPSGEGAQRSSVWSFPRGRSAPRPAPFRGCGEDPARLRWVDRRSTCRCDGCMTLTPDHSSCGCAGVSRVLQLGEGGPALPCLGLWAPEPPWVRVTSGVRGSCPQAAHITPQVIPTPRKTRMFPGAAGGGGRTPKACCFPSSYSRALPGGNGRWEPATAAQKHVRSSGQESGVVTAAGAEGLRQVLPSRRQAAAFP